jgi:hypothetical protein
MRTMKNINITFKVLTLLNALKLLAEVIEAENLILKTTL